jgi:hypothetical protein
MQRGGRQWSPLSGRSHRCRGRWPPSSREERRKLSSREVAIVDGPWGHPYAPHRRERELVVRPTVLDLGEDAREASRCGRRSRTLGSGWAVAPLPCLARAATGTSTPPSHHALLERPPPLHASLEPPPTCLAHAAAALPSVRARCHRAMPRSHRRRYEHDTDTPHSRRGDSRGPCRGCGCRRQASEREREGRCSDEGRSDASNSG